MLPELNAQMQSRESQVSAFLGIHYGEGPSMGQAEETQNLSTARFPALCTREGRAQEGTWTNATGIYYRGGLLTVAGSKLYFDGTEIGDITPGGEAVCHRQQQDRHLPGQGDGGQRGQDYHAAGSLGGDRGGAGRGGGRDGRQQHGEDHQGPHGQLSGGCGGVRQPGRE